MRATQQRGTGKRTPPEESDEAIESQLFSYLGQVQVQQPRPEFVHKLKTRLTSEPSVTLEKQRSKMAAFVVAASGLFVGALIVWIVSGIRALLNRRASSPTS